MRTRFSLVVGWFTIVVAFALSQALSGQQAASTPKPAVAAPRIAAPAPVAAAAPVQAAVPVQVAAPAPAVAPPEAYAPEPAALEIERPEAPAGPAQPTPPVRPASPTQKPGQAPPAPPAPPSPPPPLPRGPAFNVRVDVTISDQSGSNAPTKKQVSLTVVDGGSGSVRSGVTVPMPTMTFPGAGEGGKPPMTSYNYRDMGLSLDVSQVAIVDNLVRLRLAVEYSPVDEKTVGSDGQPVTASPQGAISFARFSQTLQLALENGKPLIVAQSSDPVPSRNRTASLEVKATILK